MARKKIDLRTFHRWITDTTDSDAEDKIRAAVIEHSGKLNRVGHFSLRPAYNSIAVGAAASETVTNSQRPKRLVVGVNYAPPDRPEGTHNNVRNDFFCAKLGGKTFVCGTSNGFEFSYLKPRIKKLWRLTKTNHLGSQFRSLEVLPEHAILFSNREKRDLLITQGHLERVRNVDDIVHSVPDVTHVFEVDNFGNVKLFISKDDRALLESRIEKKEKIWFAFSKTAIEVGKDSRDVKFGKYYEAAAAPTLFAAPLGTNVIGGRSSSTLVEGESVPVIATIRARPGETRPKYQKDLPKVGAIVSLVGTRPQRAKLIAPAPGET
jgi:hypothetical protein